MVSLLSVRFVPAELISLFSYRYRGGGGGGGGGDGGFFLASENFEGRF